MTDVPVTLRPPSVSERVKVNPNCSRAMNALTFIIKTEYTANKNRQTLSQPKPWCNDSGVLNLHHGYYLAVIKRARGLYGPENLDRGRKYRPNAVRAVHTTEVKILPYRPT